MDWYYAKNDIQMGPVPQADLQQLIRSGELLPGDMVWREGMADWKPVSGVPELTGAVVATGTAMPTMPAGVMPFKKTSGLAVASMVCGLIGLIGFFICFVPGLAGLGGIICGHTALRQIKRSGGQLEGRGFAICGLITGYLSLLIIVIAFMVFVFVAMWGNKPTRVSPQATPMREAISIDHHGEAY